jgi:hypothetical protein
MAIKKLRCKLPGIDETPAELIEAAGKPLHPEAEDMGLFLRLHTVELLIPVPSSFEVKMATKKLRCKLPGIDETPAELIKAAGKPLHPEVHSIIHSVQNRDVGSSG